MLLQMYIRNVLSVCFCEALITLVARNVRDICMRVAQIMGPKEGTSSLSTTTFMHESY